jgi:hypothetical protein
MSGVRLSFEAAEYSWVGGGPTDDLRLSGSYRPVVRSTEPQPQRSVKKRLKRSAQQVRDLSAIREIINGSPL